MWKKTNSNKEKEVAKFTERRKYKRIKKNFILRYFDMANPNKKFEASQLKNISLGGVCIITEVPFKPPTKLGVELKTPFLTELTHLEGNVLESHEGIKGIIYETRIEFEKLSPQAEFILNRIIQFFEMEEKNKNEQN